MKRSRSGQSGLAGFSLMKSLHNTSAISAMPMGMPGCPELACWTASMARMRMALASSRRSGIGYCTSEFRAGQGDLLSTKEGAGATGPRYHQHACGNALRSVRWRSGGVAEAADQIVEEQAVQHRQRDGHNKRGRHQLRPVEHIAANQFGGHAGTNVACRRAGDEGGGIDVIAHG